MSAHADVTVVQPFAQVRISAADVSDHAIMRARQLAELLVLMQPEDGAGPTLWLAQQMADELVCAVAGMIGVKA